MKLSVIIPHYNEKTYVKEILRRVEAVPLDKEIILVDDGSSAEVRTYLKNEIEGRFEDLRIFYHERNQGKGAAIRTALGHVRGDIVIIQDADLEYDPQDYLPIYELFKDPKVQVVYGSRHLNVKNFRFLVQWFSNRFLGGQYKIGYFHHFAGVQAMNMIANILFAANTTDTATCYKAFRSDILKQIPLDCIGFEFCMEVTAKVRKAGYKIYEVPISYHPRSKEQGKKLRWMFGFKAISTFLHYRFFE
jgi:glycosyltransferase involved in cell wall biosynthesis